VNAPGVMETRARAHPDSGTSGPPPRVLRTRATRTGPRAACRGARLAMVWECARTEAREDGVLVSASRSVTDPRTAERLGEQGRTPPRRMPRSSMREPAASPIQRRRSERATLSWSDT
jgi:hypothetical protein